jgi:hypothetical protein
MTRNLTASGVSLAGSVLICRQATGISLKAKAKWIGTLTAKRVAWRSGIPMSRES